VTQYEPLTNGREKGWQCGTGGGRESSESAYVGGRRKCTIVLRGPRRGSEMRDPRNNAHGWVSLSDTSHAIFAHA
jgi:hypothetical protein